MVQASALGGPTAHGGYVAPELKMSTLSQTPATLAGLEGEWVINLAS